MLLVAVCLIADGAEVVPGGRLNLGKDQWVIEHWEDINDFQGIRVSKNGAIVKEMGDAGLWKAVRVKTPASFPVFIVKSHSGAGHGENTYLYGIRQGQFKSMGSFPYGEIGGPVFRDLDRDRIPEWIFDNFYWYDHHGDGPTQLVAYKLTRSGDLRKWRTLKNPKRQHLPRNSRVRF
jgi:hypothetical protein